MNPDYVALGVIILLVLSVLVAWWYVSRPTPEIPVYGTTVIPVSNVAGYAVGARVTIGSGKRVGSRWRLWFRPKKREVATVLQVSPGGLTVSQLKNTYPAGTPITPNRAQRRAKRWS